MSRLSRSGSTTRCGQDPASSRRRSSCRRCGGALKRLLLSLPQRYAPIDERHVRYVGVGTDFVAELECDDDGLVLNYQDLAERVTQ
jgi:hypothetical protein